MGASKSSKARSRGGVSLDFPSLRSLDRSPTQLEGSLAVLAVRHTVLVARRRVSMGILATKAAAAFRARCEAARIASTITASAKARRASITLDPISGHFTLAIGHAINQDHHRRSHARRESLNSSARNEAPRFVECSVCSEARNCHRVISCSVRRLPLPASLESPALRGFRLLQSRLVVTGAFRIKYIHRRGTTDWAALTLLRHICRSI